MSVHEQRGERRVWLGHAWMAPVYREQLKSTPPQASPASLEERAFQGIGGGDKPAVHRHTAGAGERVSAGGRLTTRSTVTPRAATPRTSEAPSRG